MDKEKQKCIKRLLIGFITTIFSTTMIVIGCVHFKESNCILIPILPYYLILGGILELLILISRLFIVQEVKKYDIRQRL